MYYLLDKNKNVIECTPKEWCDFIERRLPTNYTQIGYDKVDDKRISTIFIGLDYGCYLHDECDCAPIVFETMVFDKDNHSILINRYSTFKDSEIGHKEAVEWVKNGCKEYE